ncbi:MAG: HNH endonuclease signature motif containing protein [Ilumatobacteraceae bacterium]|nr:HNH endonuclease signature motif containing protein [Ilumatobacteraceae bacterium]
MATDLGRRQRLFTGSAREAAKLLTRTCTHPDCRVPSRFAEVDHIDEWAGGSGATDQHNADVRCGGHNRFEHRQRWRTRRDRNGRSSSIRPDGTIVLPVGEREPDLTSDELTRIARALVADLVPLQPAG